VIAGRRLVLLPFALSLPLVSACKHDSDTPGGPADASAFAVTCVPTPAGAKQAAGCDVTVEAPPVQANPSRHAPEGTSLTYCSNPPSSGTHYPIWAQFQEYDHPVAEPYLVHDLEHGAVILYWKCDQPDGSAAPCVAPPGVLDALHKVRDDTPTDASCDPSIRVRIIIVPSTTIDTPIAAAAWGATYHAACADVPTLDAFVHDHYGQGPEQLCAPGEPF
jgi:hypothetical protein